MTGGQRNAILLLQRTISSMYSYVRRKQQLFIHYFLCSTWKETEKYSYQTFIWKHDII